MTPRLPTGVVVTLAVAFAGSGCGKSPDTRADLAFVSSRDGDYAVYEMSADGGSQKRLTENPRASDSSPQATFFQVEPAWSSDGTRIVFASRRAGSFDIYVMNSDGTGTHRVTSAREHETHPTWSSDAARIAFAGGDPSDIYVVNADGSGARRISDPTVEETQPAWSPDGKWIAYVRRTPGTPFREVWLMRPDGSARHALTRQEGTAFTPAWSPDSRRIVFSSNADGEVYELYTVGIDGKGLRSVVRTVQDNFEPSWSLDGSKIAYQEDGAIFTVELGGGDVKKLTDNANNDSSPVWNPAPPKEES